MLDPFSEVDQNIIIPEDAPQWKNSVAGTKATSGA
jgi:hypothetical protein